jgi:Trypsin-like peptidase domain/Effector-associated domain 2
MHPWRVRLEDSRTGAGGAGVVVTDRHILTCAHVVTSDEGMLAGFPGTGSDAAIPVTVADGGWFPSGENERADLAVLQSPQGLPIEATQAALARGEPSVGRTVYAFGHPHGMNRGLWTRGQLHPTAGPGAEWMQLSGIAEVDRRIEPGFSGAGVLDPETDSVIGIVVAASRRPGDRLAWMVPMEVVAGYWPPLVARITPESSAAMEPTSDWVMRFVSALAGTRTMKDGRSRDQVVASLHHDILVRVPRQPGALPDIYGIVLACLDFDDGLTQLVTVVRFLEGPTRSMRALDQVLAEATRVVR